MSKPRKRAGQSPLTTSEHATVPAARASSLRPPGEKGRPLALLVAGFLLIAAAWGVRSSAWLHERFVKGKDVSELEALVRQQPDDAIARYYLARRYYTARRLEDAEAAYESVVRLDPGSARAHLGLGLTLFDRGKLPQAQAELARTLQLDSQQAPAEYTLGRIAWLQGNLREALPHLQRATHFDPNSAPIWYGLAVCSIQAGQRDKALEPLQHAIAHDPNNPQYHTTLGELLVFYGKTEEGRRHYEQALQRDPNYGPAVALLGKLYLYHLPGLDSLTRAEQLLLQATHLKTLRPVEVYQDLGKIYFQTGQYQKAVSALQEAIRQDPHDRQSYYQLAQAERRGGDRQAAAAAQQQFQRLNQWHLDQRALEAHLQQNPEDTAGHLKLARTYVELGMIPQAGRQYQVAMQQQSGNGEITREFARFVRQQQAQATAAQQQP